MAAGDHLLDLLDDDDCGFVVAACCHDKRPALCGRRQRADRVLDRSEEHTSELQSLIRLSYAVFCLKKNTTSKSYADAAKPSDPHTLYTQLEHNPRKSTILLATPHSR